MATILAATDTVDPRLAGLVMLASAAAVLLLITMACYCFERLLRRREPWEER